MSAVTVGGRQTGHRMRKKEGWNYFRLTEAPLSACVPCPSVTLIMSDAQIIESPVPIESFILLV